MTRQTPLPDWVEVGRILKAHGIRGEVLVRCESDLPERFHPGSLLRARRTDSRGTRDLEVVSSRSHNHGLLVRFLGISDREAASALKGAVLEGQRLDRPREDRVWFHYELEGCSCRDVASGRPLGEVTEVLEDGGGVVLVVRTEEHRYLIPFVHAFIDRIDIDQGVIDFRLPDGLIEACGSAL